MSRNRNAAALAEDAAPVFAALGEPTRLRLVGRLCADGPLSIARLSEGSGVTRQAVTIAYLNDFRLIAIIALLALPFIMMLRPPGRMAPAPAEAAME